MRLEDHIMLKCRDAEEQRTRAERSGTARNQIRTDSQQKYLPSPLTDKAGAGKTFVAISLVCKDIEKKQGCTVVVVPQTILAQWKAAGVRST
jgi:RecG-like helicase